MTLKDFQFRFNVRQIMFYIYNFLEWLLNEGEKINKYKKDILY